MKIVYTVPQGVVDHLEKKIIEAGHQACIVAEASAFTDHNNADLFIDGCFNGTFYAINAPLLINNTAFTLNTIPAPMQPTGRICAWPGFWEQPVWEVAAGQDDFPIFQALLLDIGISCILSPDIPGLIAPRILSTIINEAAFTLAAGVASIADIDTAMKLGTNYPWGPIEWAQKIGLSNIQQVLQSMAAEYIKYKPHPDLLTLAK